MRGDRRHGGYWGFLLSHVSILAISMHPVPWLAWVVVVTNAALIVHLLRRWYLELKK